MFTRLTVVAVGAACVLAGCQKNSNPESAITTIDAAAIAADTQLSPAAKAERLAKASEQLLTAQGFDYASEVADLAIAQDPNNVRAQFVKAMLAPIRAQKGIIARVAPLAQKDAKVEQDYEQFVEKIEVEHPNSTLKTFLTDGKADIKTEADVQQYLDSVAQGFKAIREFAKSNKSSSLTVMSADTWYAAMEQRFKEACEIIQLSPYSYETKCPSPANLLEVKLSRADWEAIQQVAAGYELYISTYNSYDLSGSYNVIEKNERSGHTTPEKTINELLKDSKFGTIRSENGFAKIKQMGLDAIDGARWMLKNQNSLCPIGRAHPRNRLGSLFNLGFCTESSAQASLELKKVEKVLTGGTVDMPIEVRGSVYMAKTRPSVLMDQPIADLRSVQPTSYDKCGSVTSIADGSVGGLFVEVDVNELLKAQACR